MAINKLTHGTQRRTFTAKNISGEEIPPYACVQLVPVDYTAGEEVGKTENTGLTHFACSKPSNASSGPYAFNGPAKVAIDGFAELVRPATTPCLALLDEYYEPGDAWESSVGPVDGEWHLSDGAGFRFGGVFPYFPVPQIGFVLIDGGGIQLSHGIILAPCNTACGTYRVQRIHRTMLSTCDECDGSGSGSGSGSGG